MTGPLLHDSWFDDLRILQEQGLRDRVTLEQLTEIRLPNGEYHRQWVAEPEEPGLLLVGGAKLADLAAAIGVKAQGILKLKRGRSLAGERAVVRGIQKGVAWQRLVEVTADLGGDTERIIRRALWVDVELTR